MSYNGGGGQPPYPPRPGNFPPFRPNLPPGSQLPPYPPGHHPPPFPPKFAPSPNAGSPRYGLGSPGGAPGGRPYHSGSSGPGLPPLPSGLPGNPNQGGRHSVPSGPRRDVKTTKVFVGSIAPGIREQTLKDLLNACGPLHELKLVEGSAGKPPAFGFASFESPEVVLRCIRCLNGIQLPDLTPAGRNNPPKALVVKADQKTAEFLQEFEETLGRSERDESADTVCRQAIARIVAQLGNNGNVQPNRPRQGGRNSPIEVIVPAHLQDLKEGDLPENQRVAVLDQIAVFRENAARRERDKKHIDEEREKERERMKLQATTRQNSSHAGYGYGTRAFPKAAPEPSPGRTPVEKVPAFVKAETSEGRAESERTDEEEEAIRRQRRERDRALALRDRENRVESLERQRIDLALREEAIRQQRADSEAKNRRIQAEDFDDWDDDELEHRGKELFYSDRALWRQKRQQARLREEQDDIDDRRKEDAEVKALEAESEQFLQRQMEELAKLEAEQRQAGLLTEDAAPVKLAISTKIEPPVVKSPMPQIPQKAALALSDDEDETAIRKRKRALVKLEHEDGHDQVMEDAEEQAKRAARLLDIRKHLPSRPRDVFATSIHWRAIEESAVRSKIQSFVQDKITDSLGELDQDLADFVMEQLSERKSPEDLIDELQAVLAEDAEPIVLQLWRQLVFESRAAQQNVSTGTTRV